MKGRCHPRGFTLIELMITVVILVILTVVASIGYKKYIIKARTTEAIGFLSDIKMKQETYFQAYGQYIDTSAGGNSHNDSDFYPADIAGGDKQWDIVCPDDKASYPGWCALGARPASGITNFQYVTVGWQSGDGDPPDTFIRNPKRRWWYAVAHGDLDNAPEQKSTFIFSSELTEVIFFNENN